MKRTPLFKAIQRMAHYMMAAAQARGELKGWRGGKCADCGTTKAWSWADEHRDYSDPYDIVTVCSACNQKRGPAILDLFNVQTGEWESVLPWTAYVKYTVKADTKRWSLKRLLSRGVISQSHLVCTPIRL